jgi:hypothetical protein
MQKNPICYWELGTNDAEKSVRFFHDYSERNILYMKRVSF